MEKEEWGGGRGEERNREIKWVGRLSGPCAAALFMELCTVQCNSECFFIFIWRKEGRGGEYVKRVLAHVFTVHVHTYP